MLTFAPDARSFSSGVKAVCGRMLMKALLSRDPRRAGTLLWSESCGRLLQAGPLTAVFEFEVYIVSVISVNLTPRNTKPFTMVPEAAFGV